jgi:hypothetical protein
MATRFEEIDNKDGFLVNFTIPGTQAGYDYNYGPVFVATRPCEMLYFYYWVSSYDIRYYYGYLNVERLVSGQGNSTGYQIINNLLLNGPGGGGSFAARVPHKYSAEQFSPTIQADGFLSSQFNAGDVLNLYTSGTIALVNTVNFTAYFKYSDKGDYR